ncbi:hypothetical protein NP493_1690g00004 [Ridgeia piscesae]|uniref:Fibrinogen C-terminal domain-containing protein n=1 Tax=Ridgeia piscesae TaxID=27915 RepID=A0AAD9JVJ2_RIDPI|nr:hypothetical protein NP493_1690g00004 [Ridgeia piscesae]
MTLMLPCLEQGETCKNMMKMLSDLVDETFKYCNFKVAKIPNDCADLYEAGCKTTGYYSIYMPKSSRTMKVFCDMTTDGGGWLVFQKRFDGSINFYRSWEAYKKGFGYLDGEYWFGNDVISEVSSMKPNVLRVDMGDWEDEKVYALYTTFVLSLEVVEINIVTTGACLAAGDSLSYADGLGFSTKDQDHDLYDDGSCAERLQGWLVVPGLSQLKLEWALSERKTRDICGRYGVEHVAWVLLLRQDDRNENEAQILQAKKLTL